MANKGLGSLTLDLVAKIGGFTAPLTQAERKLDATARAMDKRSREIGARGVAIEHGFAKIGIAIGTFAVGIAGFLAKGTKSAIDFADQLNDMNIRLGISAEALSGWGFAAKQTGTDIEALGRGFKTLTKNLTEASVDATSEQAKLFEALGVSRDSLNDIEKALPQIAEGFKNLDNEVLEATLAQQLFGKAGIDLLEFLNQGEDGLEAMRQRARELGIELGQDTLTAADQFNDSLGELKAVAEGFFLQIAQDLLPKLIELTQALVDLSKEGTTVSDVAKQVGNAFDFVVEWTGRAYAALDGIGKVIEGVTAGFVELFGAATAVANLDFAKMRAILQNSNSADLVRLGAAQVVTQQRFTGTAATASQGMDISLGAPLSADERAAMEARVNRALAGSSGTKKAKTGKSDEEKEADRLKQAYDSLNESLKEQLALVGSNTEASKVYFAVTEGSLAKLKPEEKQRLLDMATELDLKKRRIDEIEAETKAQEKLDEARAKEQERISDFISDMELELSLIGMTNKEREREIALRYAGSEATEEQRKKIIELTDAQMQAAKVADFWDNTQQELANSLYDLAKNASDAESIVKGFFDAIGDYITRAIAENWAERITDLFRTQPGGGGSAGGSGGGWISAAISALFGGGLATGGMANAGMFYRVNENGPELLSIGGRDFLMMGNQSGMVRPNVSNSTNSRTTNIYVQGTATNETLRQIERANGVRSAREIARTGR